MSRLLQVYRVLAIVTGIGLVILTFVGVPLRYAAHSPGVVEIVGPLHGFLYIAYLAVTLLLGVARRWHPLKTILVMAAGTIPLAAFFAEHRVVKDERAATAVGPTPAV